MEGTYQLKVRTASASFNSELEKQTINEQLRKLSVIAGRELETFKDVFIFLLNAVLSDHQPQTQTENTLQPLVAKAIEVIGYDENETPTAEQVISDLLDMVQQPLPEAPVVEVIKEVERPLQPGEHLLVLNPDQDNIIKTIARWRSRKNYDSITQTVTDVMKAMVFNIPTLTNDHGAYPTGFKLNKLSKKLELKS